MARVHPPHFWEKWMRRFVRSEMMMKAVWKKLIAVAFCGATAASMLSVGASAAWYNDNLIEYGMFAENSRTVEIEDDKGYSYGSVYVSMTAENWNDGDVTVNVNFPKGVTGTSVSYDWSGNVDHCNGNTAQVNMPGGGKYSAVCNVTVSCTYKNWNNREITVKETIKVSVSGRAWSTEGDAVAAFDKYSYDDNTGGYYNDKWYDRYDWDRDKIYWDGDYYWYYSGGRWHATTSYPGLPDWDRPSRPSYSKEYEVDWSDDTFYYNGKVQMPSATVTIGGRTIELDVKLISGDGTSVGRHRVRASLPSRYSRYDITGTTLYYEIEEPEKDGFVTENGNTYYYDNGRKVTGWQTINGSRYYFLDNGEAADGWVKDGPADWYYFSDGKMQTGWINDNGTTYYCYGTGKMCHGRWHEIAGKWYYFNESGAMLTSRWILDKGNWYYVAGDGVMATNTTVPGGYRVNASGVWVK